MDVQSLRKEVRALPTIESQLEQLQQSWIKPLRQNAGHTVSFSQNLSPQSRQQLHRTLTMLRKQFQNIALGQQVTTNLQQQARTLIEIKLSLLRGDSLKAAFLTNQLLHDEVHSFRKTLHNFREFELAVLNLWQDYLQLNDWLQPQWSLEENVQFNNLPHQHHLSLLLRTTHQQKRLICSLGQQFVALCRAEVKT